LEKVRNQRRMWEDIRSLFIGYIFDSMEKILIALYYGFEKQKPLIWVIHLFLDE